MSYITGDIVTRVQQRVRDTSYSASEIKGYLNDTQNDVFNEYRLPFMETTQDYTLVAGTADITNGVGLPANYVQAIDILLTSTGYEKCLRWRDVREMDSLYPDYENSSLYPNSVPSDVYKYAGIIKTFPKPNTAYTVTLRYYKKPALLDADAGVPELPSEFEELLIAGAAYRVLQVKDNYDQAGVLENKYMELLDKLVAKYSQAQVGRPVILRTNRRAVGKSHR